MKKEKQEKHKEFTVVNKGKEETKRQKHPLIYSNRWQKIQKGRTIRITPTTRPNQRGSTGKTLITEPQFFPRPQKTAYSVQSKKKIISLFDFPLLPPFPLFFTSYVIYFVHTPWSALTIKFQHQTALCHWKPKPHKFS